MPPSSSTSAPLVSVIIPTFHRPVELTRAIRSVLAQTFGDFDIIVVHDGPDPTTRAALDGIDPRVRYLELDTNSGPAAARNFGVNHSQSEWIAFLDDDDEWLPTKLEAQVNLIRPEERNVIFATRMFYRRSEQDDAWPSRPIGEQEDLSEYILKRDGIFGRPGVLSISTFLVPRQMLLDFPLVTAPDHEDWSWILQVHHLMGAKFRFVWEPLAIYTINVDSLSRSRRTNWRESIEWANENRPYITTAAYNSFLATKVALKTKRQGDWKGLFEISRRVLSDSPSLLDIVFLTGMALLPASLLNLAWRRSLKSKESKSAEVPA